MEMLISFSSTLAPVHTANGTKSWFNDHGVTVFDWPANSPDLKPIENLDERHQTQQYRWPEAHREYMGYCQEEDERHQTQQCRRAEGRYQSHLGFITPEQCHRPITSMPRRIEAVIHAKEPQTSIEWIEMNIPFRSLTFLFKISFFSDLM